MEKQVQVEVEAWRKLVIEAVEETSDVSMLDLVWKLLISSREEDSQHVV